MGECPICLAGVSAQDSAMRCAGKSGVHHYFHASCLEEWVHHCRRERRCPRCPLCLGALQSHRGRLRELLLKNSDVRPLLLEAAREEGSDVWNDSWGTADPVEVGVNASWGFVQGFVENGSLGSSSPSIGMRPEFAHALGFNVGWLARHTWRAAR